MLPRPLLIGLSFASTILAGSLTISPDATCGGYTGYQCQGSGFGDCCSQHGYCGTSSDYCGVGCQAGFGTCKSSPPPPVSTSRPTVSTDARCGYQHGATSGATCLGSAFGNCCSQYSYCGSSDAFCGTGCQPGYGNCNECVKPITTKSITTKPKSSSSSSKSSSSKAKSSSTKTNTKTVSTSITSPTTSSAIASASSSSSSKASTSTSMTSTFSSSSSSISSTTAIAPAPTACNAAQIQYCLAYNGGCGCSPSIDGTTAYCRAEIQCTACTSDLGCPSGSHCAVTAKGFCGTATFCLATDDTCISGTPPPFGSSSSLSSTVSSTNTYISSSTISTSTATPSAASSSTSSFSATSSSTTSSSIPQTTAKIAGLSAANLNTLGYLQLNPAGDQFILGGSASANTFSFSTGTNTVLQQAIVCVDCPSVSPYLAGLISSGINLQSTNSNSAIVGLAPVQTAPGATPQTGGSTSIPGTAYESSIWEISPPIGSRQIQAQWVNYDSTSLTATFVWDPVGQSIYLTANPAAVILNHPGAQEIAFQYV